MTNEEDKGIFRQDYGTMPEIKSLWAYVAVDPKDGNEGIPAFRSGNITVPLIASDRIRREEYRPIAQRLANDLGVPVKLVEFQNRVEIEVIEPEVYSVKKPLD
jgi:hypothetical protein